MWKKLFPHILLKVFFRSACFQYRQCLPEHADILFHKVCIIAAAYQFQVSNADFPEPVKGAESASGSTAEIALRKIRIVRHHLFATKQQALTAEAV